MRKTATKTKTKTKTWTTFMDEAEQNKDSWLRETLFDNHVFCNTTFRSEYGPVSDYALDYASKHGIKHIVEMGAGTAPLTTRMAESPKSKGIKLTACDRNPHVAAYEELELQHDNVSTIKHCVDFSEAHQWGPSTMLLLLGTFPALPQEIRRTALRNMTQSAERVMVWECVRKTRWSIFLASLTFFVALLLPLAWFHKPGRFRRILWCWLVPVVPLIVVFDGVGWCLRAWTDEEWKAALEEATLDGRTPYVKSWINSQVVIW